MTGRLLRRLRWAHLVPVAAGLALRVRLTGRRDPFPAIRPPRRPLRRGRARPEPERVVRAVDLATRWPLRSTCLVRSLVAATLLGRYGHRARVVIGVPAHARPDGTWRAHAWVEVEGRAPRPSGFREIAGVRP